MSQELTVPPRGTEFRYPDPEWKPMYGSRFYNPSIQNWGTEWPKWHTSGSVQDSASKKKKKWWQPFEKTTNINNCCLPHRDTQRMSLSYRHVYTAAHTHSYTGGREEREKIKMQAKKKKEKEEEGRSGKK